MPKYIVKSGNRAAENPRFSLGYSEEKLLIDANQKMPKVLIPNGQRFYPKVAMHAEQTVAPKGAEVSKG